MLEFSSRPIELRPPGVPALTVVGRGTPSMSMSAPTQPDGPVLKVTLYQVTELPETVTGPAVTTPTEYLGCVPTSVPSAVARTFVAPVVKVSWPTTSGGVAARVEEAENANARIAKARHTNTTARAGIHRFMGPFSEFLEDVAAGRNGA